MSAVGNILKFPVHVLQLFSGAKSFEKNPVIGSRFLNARGLHVARVSLAMRMAQWRRRKLAHLVPEACREAYRRDGFVRIDDFLDSDHFAALVDEVRRGGFERIDMHQGSTVTRRSLIDAEDLQTRPALAKAKNDTLLRNLVCYVASYCGQPLITLQSVLALPAENGGQGIDPQTMVHSDTFHPTAKAWLFLTDVGEDGGPFSYVAGSHRMTERRYRWEKDISASLGTVENKYARRGSLRISAGELDALGYPQPTVMTVRANTLIVADTHGFHARCASAQPTVRVELYASLRRNPFLPFVARALGGLHPAALPYLRNRTNRMAVEGLRMLQKLGIGANPWRDMGEGPVDEWPFAGETAPPPAFTPPE